MTDWTETPTRKPARGTLPPAVKVLGDCKRKLSRTVNDSRRMEPLTDTDVEMLARAYAAIDRYEDDIRDLYQLPLSADWPRWVSLVHESI